MIRTPSGLVVTKTFGEEVDWDYTRPDSEKLDLFIEVKTEFYSKLDLLSSQVGTNPW